MNADKIKLDKFFSSYVLCSYILAPAIRTRYISKGKKCTSRDYECISHWNMNS